MINTLMGLAASLFAASVVFAQAPAPAAPGKSATPPAAVAVGSCASKAMDKNGKPLAGAAKTSFMKKCEADSGGAVAELGCAAKAVSKDGKALAGAAKTSFMKKCEAESGGMATAGSSCAAKAVSKDGKALAGAAKASFMKKCESDAKGGK